MLRLNIDEAHKWNGIQKRQWQGNAELQGYSELGSKGFKVITDNVARITGNAGLSPAEAYREMEGTSVEAMNPIGEFATYQRMGAVSRSVGLGKQVYTYRQAGKQEGGQTSMSGQVGIITDAVDFKYAGVPVPIHDHGTQRNWRNLLTMGADGFDAMVDDVRESELTVLRQAENYLWVGDATIVGPNGETWLGIDNDPSLAQETGVIDLVAATPEAAYNEIIRLVDILRINNNCAGMLKLAVSQRTLSKWQSPFTTNTGAWGTTLDMIRSVIGIEEVYADPRLTLNTDVFIANISQQGFHSITGQALSSYMVERTRHNDNFTMIKWLAQSFVSKNDHSGKKCALRGKA